MLGPESIPLYFDRWLRAGNAWQSFQNPESMLGSRTLATWVRKRHVVTLYTKGNFEGTGIYRPTQRLQSLYKIQASIMQKMLARHQFQMCTTIGTASTVLDSSFEYPVHMSDFIIIPSIRPGSHSFSGLVKISETCLVEGICYTRHLLLQVENMSIKNTFYAFCFA